MDPKATKDQQTNSAEEQVKPCTKGHEVLSARDISAYLRSIEEGVEPPPGVQAHIAACSICKENWDFVKETEQAFRQFRRERVKLIIRKVEEEDATMRAVMDAEETFASPQANTEVD